MCDKNTYSTKEEARKSLVHIQKKPGKNHKPIRYYECDKCGFWHLTSKPLNPYLTGKNVKLNHINEWDALFNKQRERAYFELPIDKQIEKSLSIIFHNINIQCEVLDQKFNYRLKKIRYHFNKKQNKIFGKQLTVKQ